MKFPFIRTAFALIAVSLLTACGPVMTKPESLQSPAVVQCIKLDKALSLSTVRGLLKQTWITDLREGIYFAEKEDAEGTYFRGPSAAYWEHSPDATNVSVIRDGGVWLPKSPEAEPRLYVYVSVDNVARNKTFEATDCNTVSYRKDPATKKISLFAATAAGGAGGVAARAAVPGSNVSYGQAAAGGAIGMGIVALMINADVGKIVLLPPDPNYSKELKALRKQAITLKEAPVPESVMPQK